MRATVFTIGHSNHSSERFVELLRAHRVTAVCDVRSRPFSAYNPQFNKDILRRTLGKADIEYVFVGEELGARSSDPGCYEDGQVVYARLAATDMFQSGIDRVCEGAQRYRVALMCAEKDPAECHRSILVAKALVERGVPVEHIGADGSLESQTAMMERLLAELKLPTSHLFVDHAQLIRDAYEIQGSRIAFAMPEADLRIAT